MDRILELIIAHEPIAAAILIIAAMCLIANDIVSKMTVLSRQLSGIATLLTSTELGQERIERVLGDISRHSN